MARIKMKQNTKLFPNWKWLASMAQLHAFKKNSSSPWSKYSYPVLLTTNQSKSAQNTNNQSNLTSKHPTNILGAVCKLGTNAFCKIWKRYFRSICRTQKFVKLEHCTEIEFIRGMIHWFHVKSFCLFRFCFIVYFPWKSSICRSFYSNISSTNLG